CVNDKVLYIKKIEGTHKDIVVYWTVDQCVFEENITGIYDEGSFNAGILITNNWFEKNDDYHWYFNSQTRPTFINNRYEGTGEKVQNFSGTTRKGRVEIINGYVNTTDVGFFDLTSSDLSQINTLQDYNGQLRYKHLDKTYHVQMSPDATVSIQLFLNLATQEVQSNFNGLDVTFDNNEVLVKW